MNEEIIDIYFRNVDIENLKEKINVIKHNKNNAFIMIDGEWGSGKTTLLKLLKKEIEEDNNVIEYNCWENSFYPDPLIAIISSITDQTDKDSDINKLGIDLMRYFRPSISLLSIGGFKIEWIRKQKNEEYKSLEKYIIDFRKKLNEFNKNNVGKGNKKTRIILVDELDRCLPEYAIKVLERLYLLLKDVNDVIVIIANNNEQLEESIRKIFGEKMDAKKYLEKFIDVTYELRYQSINRSNILEKFKLYFNKFSFNDEYDQELVDLIAYFAKEKDKSPRQLQKDFELLATKHDIAFNENIDIKQKEEICICELLLYFLSVEKIIQVLKDITDIIETINKFNKSLTREFIDSFKNKLSSHHKVILKYMITLNDYSNLFENIVFHDNNSMVMYNSNNDNEILNYSDEIVEKLFLFYNS